MHNSLNIGGLLTKSNIILAPMSGVTDAPFRYLVKKFCPDAITFSEMIASDAAIREIKDAIRRIKINDNEKDLCGIQIAGYNSEVIAEAARIAEDSGAKIVDLNFGCPVKKIVNNYSGSALMKDEARVREIVRATVKAVKVPVTVKTRLGWDLNSFNAPEIARIAEEEGAKMITIHGRTRSQMFNGNANWEAVQNVVNAVKIPVIVNGDIKNHKDAIEALRLSGANGVMIGRATYGKPWLIAKILDAMRGNIQNEDNHYNISQEEKINTIFEHCELIIEHYGDEIATGFLKKHLSWYISGYKDAATFRGKINRLNSSNEIVEVVKDFFANQI
jgi:tRNA-dihydrouridine synthase B